MSVPSVLSSPRRRKLLLRLILNGLTQALAALGTAWLVKLTFDQFLMHVGSSPAIKLWMIALGLALMAALAAVLRMWERTDAERLGQHYAKGVRMRLYDQLSAFSPQAMQQRSQGGVMLRFVGDLTAVRQWVSLGLARLTVGAIVALVALSVLATVSWVLALGAGIVFVCGVLISSGLGPRLQLTVSAARRRLSHLAANINEKIAAIAVVQIFGQSRRERQRVKRQSRLLQEAMVERAKVAGKMRAVTEATAALATATVLLLGVFEVHAGQVSPGTVVAAMTIVGLLVPYLRDLGRVQEYWYSYRVSRQKIQEFLETPSLVSEATNAVELQPGQGRLELEAVGMSGILHDVSAVAEPGSVVAVVGPNGAGKSTLLALAARLMDPDSGVVRLDGQDLSKATLSSVRRAVGMASPGLPLLRGTLSKNLLYRWPDAPAEEIARVRALCGIDGIVAQLPEGEQTQIVEGGARLSTGQRQRIALARALLGDPVLLLLDEVDSHLDPQAGAILDRVLAEQHGTVLIVTHNAERIANADVIWYLQGGRLVETGTPAELLAVEGPTRRLLGVVSRKAVL